MTYHITRPGATRKYHGIGITVPISYCGIDGAHGNVFGENHPIHDDQKVTCKKCRKIADNRSRTNSRGIG